jgi:hypothetical protein
VSAPSRRDRGRAWAHGRSPRGARATAVAAVAVSLALGGASCSTGDARADAPAPTTTEATTTTTAPPEPAVVELLDPGAEPRRAARIQLTQGESVTSTLTVDLAIEQDIGGTPQRLDAPPLDQVVTSSVVSVDDEGAVVELVIDDASYRREGSGLTDAQADELDAQVSSLAGTTTVARISPLAESEVQSFEVPDGVDDTMAATVEQVGTDAGGLSLVLPTEPIGVGARWRVTTTRTIGGLEQTTVATFELTSFDGDVLTYDATLEATADEQEIAGARLLTSTTSGTGTGTVRLTSLLAEQEVRGTSEQRLEVDGPDGPAEVDQTVETALAQRPSAG